MKEAAVPTRCAVDICVSSSNAFTLATNRHLPEKEAEGAPVLFVSHSDGTIECLLLDNEEQELVRTCCCCGCYVMKLFLIELLTMSVVV